MGRRDRRIGLEQEFFLVDQTGALSNLADRFLRYCQETARAEGLDPRCFKPECAANLVEITTPPSVSFPDLARNYLCYLSLALEVGAELGFTLYPLATYPLPITPRVYYDDGYEVQARTIGLQRFSHAGRCAGVHLHLELPAGTVWPDVKAALDAPVPHQQELLDVYNLATALDPALVALTRSCPFYEGRAVGFAARTAYYRGMLGLNGLYADLQEVGALSPYATRVQDLIDQQDRRYRAWYAAMDLAGIERKLFASTSGNLHRASWNPIRLNNQGTVEIRTMDANYPEVILSVCALIHGAAERVRRERLEVRSSRGVLTLEPDGDLLRVPFFSYLNGELLGAAVTRGVLDQRVDTFVDSVVGFSFPYLENPELVESLGPAGNYRTTEREIVESLPDPGVSLTREQGLALVREACRRLKEQVSSLRRRFYATLAGDERDRGVARVIEIGGSPAMSAEGVHPAMVHDAKETARTLSEGTA